MTISVKACYFAVFRERAGCDSEQLNTESGNVAELYSEIATRHGFMDSHDRCKVAINGTLAGWDSSIQGGDEILFFPPVAGG